MIIGEDAEAHGISHVDQTKTGEGQPLTHALQSTMHSPNDIKIIVQNQVFILKRELLACETDNQTIKLTSDFTLPLPDWVTRNTYFLLVKYLQTKDVTFLVADPASAVNLLRTSDYLGMSKFQDLYISQVLIPNINESNCLLLLQQSHKKLRSIDNSQSWYNLLNMSISFLSLHIYEIFNAYPGKFVSLNEKILTEVLDRVIRYERKNNFANKHMLFKLIMECKCKDSKEMEKNNICRELRETIMKKKIHTKIHAKLSWKLEKIKEITDKKTKIFKFLDLKWLLNASKVDKASKMDNGLLVTLNIVPSEFEKDESQYSSNFQQSESSSKSQKSLQFQKEVASDEKTSEDWLLRNDTFTKIGVFYSKVIWKMEQRKIEKQINLHYMLMKSENPIPIILFDEESQMQIGNSRVELTIYCNMDQIYTFLLNYVYYHFDGHKFRGPNFCLEELHILLRLSKNQKNYSTALRIATQILYAYPNEKYNSQLSKGFILGNLTKVEKDIYANLFGNQAAPQNYFVKVRPVETPQQQEKRNISPISMTPSNYFSKPTNLRTSSNKSIQKTSNGTDEYANLHYYQHLDVNSKIMKTTSNREVDSSLNNSRADSKGSKRKIFSRPKIEQGTVNGLMEQMMRVTDFTRYLTQDALHNSDTFRSFYY